VTALRAFGIAALLAGAFLALTSCSKPAPGRTMVSAPLPPPAAIVPQSSPAPVPEQDRAFELAGEFTQGGWMTGMAPAGASAVLLDGQHLALDDSGRFFAAFDRDATPTATLSAAFPDGTAVSRSLAIAPRAWQIERVSVPPRPAGVTSAEFQRIRAGELAAIKAARALLPASGGWRQRFVWPVRGRISGRFGSQRIYRGTPGSYHSGTDIATGESGTPFAAPADGVVVLAAASSYSLEGNLLILDHGMGLTSAFLHCSQLLVGVGESVRQGQIIGRIGMTGRATGPHLHWSLKWREARLDPELFAR
jgi:murein DD-endopeptidase MepM/ murein hydrolase activator NlpD